MTKAGATEQRAARRSEPETTLSGEAIFTPNREVRCDDTLHLVPLALAQEAAFLLKDEADEGFLVLFPGAGIAAVAVTTTMRGGNSSRRRASSSRSPPSRGEAVSRVRRAALKAVIQPSPGKVSRRLSRCRQPRTASSFRSISRRKSSSASGGRTAAGISRKRRAAARNSGPLRGGCAPVAARNLPRIRVGTVICPLMSCPGAIPVVESRSRRILPCISASKS